MSRRTALSAVPVDWSTTRLALGRIARATREEEPLEQAVVQ
ncbi:MAG TPA: hypothetical protein VFO18_11505 [Methylomirabilota bacterium]|nr:hypothetical protein [Methylomirabilota bacterium]